MINVIDCHQFFSLLKGFNEELKLIDENYDQREYLLIVRYQLRYSLHQMQNLTHLSNQQKQTIIKCETHLNNLNKLIDYNKQQIAK